MRIQHKARVIIIDEQKRVLLILVDDRQPIHPDYPNHVQFWITPGGSVESGETFETAALRELAEETGIHVSSAGEPIWTFNRELRFSSGELVTFEESFFVVYVDSPEIKPEQLSALELYANLEYHWWTLNELQKSNDLFMPPWLPERVANLL